MHELGLALEICRIVEEQVGGDALSRVREVGLVVGAESGVEPDSLDFCLGALLSSPPFAGARATMELKAGDDLRVTYLEVEDGDPPD